MLPFATPRAVTLALWIALIPASPDEEGTVTGLQILPTAERTEVVIALDGAVETRDFTMAGPDRLVIDLLGARYAMAEEEFPELNRGGIRGIHASQYSEDAVRIVLELNRPLGYSVVSGDGFIRLSLENPDGGFEPWGIDAVTAGGGPSAADGNGPGAELPGGSGTTRALQNAGVGTADDATSSVVHTEEADPAALMRVTFSDTPMREVLFTFSEFSGRSIVPGSNVAGSVSADIREQPWDIALQTILESHGLAAREQASGIIRVDNLEDLAERTRVEQRITRTFRVNFGSADELTGAVESLLSERGDLAVSQGTNSLVVTDVPGVLDSVEGLLGGLDQQTAGITISAQIIFVNRTDLEELGIIYDLRDTEGTGLQAPDGVPVTLQGEDVVAPGTSVAVRGDAIAAIGKAGETVSDPSLSILSQMVLGRYSLISFVTALESLQLSDIQARPQVSTLDNRPARIQVGERTPVRGVQQGGQQEQEGMFFGPPQIEFVETGIILEVTPTVTAEDLIFLDLRAERSGVEEVGIELGYRFNTQEAETQVLVEDGETVVIGGLTATEVEERRVGIPILQHLPVVGRLFGYTAETRTQQDLIILVTPEIHRR